MDRIRRSKKRNYTIFIVVSALLLTAGYATFAQPLANKLATVLPDNSRFGLWKGIINKDEESKTNAGTNSGSNAYNGNGGSSINYIINNKGKKSSNNGQGKNQDQGVVNKQWDIAFTGASKVGASDNVIENNGVTYNNLFASFDVLFHETGDYIIYNFTIKNRGELDAKLEGYDIVTTNEDNYKFEVEGLTDGDTLGVGETKNISVKTTYIGSTTDASSYDGGEISLTIRYVQK